MSWIAGSLAVRVGIGILGDSDGIGLVGNSLGESDDARAILSLVTRKIKIYPFHLNVTCTDIAAPPFGGCSRPPDSITKHAA